uniref:hypothetical protein n=1 Tax=Flavobacterium sp. TaxID=239 RepID=UPI00404921D8
ARNWGIKNSSFQSILFLDSDDAVLPDYFNVLNKFKSQLNNDVKFLTFSYKLNNINVFRIFNPFRLFYVNHSNYKFFCTNSILIEKTVFNKFLFDENLNYGEDLKLWSQITSEFLGKHINIPISKYYFDYKSYGKKNNYFKQIKFIKYFIKFELLGRFLKARKITWMLPPLNRKIRKVELDRILK